MARKCKNPIVKAHRATMGVVRAKHFANGGTVEAWRGRKMVRTDRKKNRSKRACRGEMSTHGGTDA
jgi:hypothetical protein